MRFKVTFYTKYNTSMQTETVEASSQQEAFHMFAVTGCYDIQVAELEETPHPVDEVKTQFECEMCDEGTMDLGYGTPYDKQKCTCCSGNWQDCQNCKPVKKVTPTDIAITSARYNVKNATPENKVWAEKRLQEELQKANKGVDWNKVPEVIQPDELKLYNSNLD